jgi:hypothetical protein
MSPGLSLAAKARFFATSALALWGVQAARAFGVLVLLLTASMAHAHKPSDSYLSLDVFGAQVDGQWDIALRDLDFVLGLDANGDGTLTWGEIRSRQAAIFNYALGHLTVSDAGAVCAAHPVSQMIDDHSDGAYAVLRFRATCAQQPKELAVAYRLFFDVDRQHRGLLKFRSGNTTQTAVLGPDSATQHFELAGTSLWGQFRAYLREGVGHIWAGLDHMLFLLSLLLPAVLISSAQGWAPVGSFRAALGEVVKVVTAFTLAHSITLSLATLGLVTLPARLVESAIALSVIVAALNNIRPFFHGSRWLVAFAFGLLHGFGFAAVLGDLGLPREALVVGLVGFNTGVEVGQLAIVAVFLPLAFLARGLWLYRKLVMLPGSAAIAGLAGIWLIERAFDLKLLPV